ncbi:SET domain-containing protein 5 [Madurella mycetomatis]|uniref:SET domain-containing protein 5 n=1 Tax=Madurella mycetomatis TaxID=100816 RepID=A0A175W136_9PEZI|nr:SET domain-containing protein 5 [Madurella mycetomatis]
MLSEVQSSATRPMAWLRMLLRPKISFVTSNGLATLRAKSTGACKFYPTSSSNPNLTVLKVSPAFEIRSSPNKGLGVFAIKNLPRDTIIIRDPLIFQYDQGEEPWQRYRRFLKLPTATQRAILELAVQRNTEQCMAVGMSVILSGKDRDSIPNIMHLEDVIATNGLGLVVDADSPGGLFLSASRINHSCVPNADHTCHEGSTDKVVLANRDISEGEEITISYIANYLPRAHRQLCLDGWGFSCQCPACDPGHSDSRLYEQRIKRLGQLCQDRCMDGVGRLRVGETWSYAELEHAAARAKSRVELISGHHALQKFARQTYLGAFDIALAQYKLQQRQPRLRDAIKLLEQVTRLDKIYFGNNSAITQEHQRIYIGLKRGYVP